MAAPWTQALELTWRPALSYYEKRTEILRCLDDRGQLQAFRVAADHIDARLASPGQQLRVRSNGLALQLQGQNADVEVAWACVVAALEMIKPTNMTMDTRYQYIVPLATPFPKAVAAARDSFLSVPDPASVEDWALVINRDGGGTVEFGVIRAEEAIPRLTRKVGRMAYNDAPDSASFWRAAEFPEVGLFVDSFWPGGQVGNAPEEVRAAWGGAHDRAAGVVDSLYAKIGVEAG